MVAIITDREMDTTLVFMKLNKRPQEEIDLYLKDQEDILSILQRDGGQTFSKLSEHFDHGIQPALSYLAHSGKISFSILEDGGVVYWDWGDY